MLRCVGLWRPRRPRRACAVPLSGGGLSPQLRRLARADIRRVSPTAAVYRSTLSIEAYHQGSATFARWVRWGYASSKTECTSD